MQLDKSKRNVIDLALILSFNFEETNYKRYLMNKDWQIIAYTSVIISIVSGTAKQAININELISSDMRSSIS